MVDNKSDSPQEEAPSQYATPRPAPATPPEIVIEEDSIHFRRQDEKVR
jgi:hypothetical protein